LAIGLIRTNHFLELASATNWTAMHRPAGPVTTALGGLIALAAAMGIGRFVYTPILPAMIEALGLSRSAAGLIASANFLGYLAGALLAARPAFGDRRAWLLAALTVSAATTAAMGLVGSLPTFLILRGLGGAASAFVLVFGSAIVLDHLPAGRSALPALHFAGVGIGITASAVLVAALLGAGGAWQSLWLGSGLLAFAGMGAVTWLIPGHAGPSGQAEHQVRQPVRPALRRLITAYGLFGFGYVITATFLVAMVRSLPSVRALEPVIWVVFGLAAAPSVALWAWVAGRLGGPASFALACVVEAAGVLASVAWPTGTGVMLAATLVGGTFMGLTARGLVQATALATGDPRRVLALMTAAFGLGQIVGPLVAGVLAERLGSFTVPSCAAVAALLGASGLVLRRDA
jgi:predicted MFS family arabinose efflux permease